MRRALSEFGGRKRQTDDDEDEWAGIAAQHMAIYDRAIGERR
jgi:hypothetical protein